MKKNKHKIIIIINCILSLVLLIISGTLAAYTSASSAKRTVSTVGSKQLFSSNILTPFDEEKDILGKAMPFSTGNDTNTFFVSICNYKQGDKTKWAAADISYQLKASLVDAEGNAVTDASILSEYKCGEKDSTDVKSFNTLKDAPISGTLSKDAASEKLYSITVPTKYMKVYQIKMIAEPELEGYQHIGRYISAAEETTSSAWRISFLQDELEQAANELGCINTKLTGSEHATLTLSWDTENVQIDPWFLEDMELSVNEDGKSITFKAGGADMPNQYSIIFYRTRAASKTETWEDIRKYITLSSTLITE